MEFKTIEKKDNEIVAVVDGVTPSFLNALRRASMYEVPTLAIEDVLFAKNSSALYDEIVAHRLGLIPLKTDLKSYTLPEECTCKGKLCAKCSIKLSLDVKGPAVVYASDLKIKDPTVKPVFPGMPIVKLLEHQELKLEAVAVLGKGRMHTKWSPGHFYYLQYPIISINHSEVKNAKIIADKYPKFLEAKGEKLELKKLKEADMMEFCRVCSDDAIEIKNEPNKFIFVLESWGQLNPEKILQEATKIMQKKLKEVKIK